LAYCSTCFVIGGWLAKRRTGCYNLPLSESYYLSSFILAAIFAQEKIVDYYIGFALFAGTATCFYWLGISTLMYDVSNSYNRIRFLAINLIVFTGAGLIGPALAGFIISRSAGLQGYVIIFTISFFMFLVAGIVSLRIKALPAQRKAYFLNILHPNPSLEP